MELKWLEDFLALAETNSFSKAATGRNVTQSAFSRRIKQLEVWLGADLIDRATYPSRLTEAGEMFVPLASEVVKTLRKARRDVHLQEDAEAQTVTVAALHTLSFTYFPAWLLMLRDRVGPVASRIKPDPGSMEENVNSLVDGECDFLLTYGHLSVPLDIPPSVFEYRILDREVILPVSVPLADGTPRHRCGSSDRVDVLGYEKASFFGGLLNDSIAEQMPHQHIVHTGSMAVGLKGMAQVGWGVAWLPESLVRNELRDTTLVRAGDDAWDMTVDIRLYKSRNNRRAIVKQIWTEAGIHPFTSYAEPAPARTAGLSA